MSVANCAPASSMPADLEAIVQFLYGAQDLDGVSFGEVPVGKPRYWWRSKLREAVKCAFGVPGTSNEQENRDA